MKRNYNSKNRFLNQDDIITAFNKAHNFKYDYSLVEYVGHHFNVTIICPIHGEFEQTPSRHKKGVECLKCSYIKRAKNNIRSKVNTDNIVKIFNNLHNFKYDYSNFKYIKLNQKSKIICPIHGEFEQTPKIHRNGHGCPSCGAGKFWYNINTYLYYIKINNQYKIGVTRKLNSPSISVALLKRFGRSMMKNIEIIDYLLFSQGQEAYNLEQKIINNNQEHLIKYSDMILESGYTETFTKNILDNGIPIC